MLRAIVVLLALCGSAAAETYPSRPVVLIVPFAIGNGGEVVSRIVADGMKGALGVPVVVKNVAGAAGSIGTGLAVNAPPDGYTIVMGNTGTHVANPLLQKLAYDPLVDLVPISAIGTNAQVLVARPDLPVAGVTDLAAWLRGRTARFATTGVGAISHLVAMQFAGAVGADVMMVPYTSTGAAHRDLAAGQVDLMWDQVPSSIPLAAGGSIKAYAVTGSAPVAGVPTMRASGFLGFEYLNWFAFYAPRGIEDERRSVLLRAVRASLASESVRGRLAMIMVNVPDLALQGPDGVVSLQVDDLKRLRPVLAAMRPE